MASALLSVRASLITLKQSQKVYPRPLHRATSLLSDIVQNRDRQAARAMASEESAAKEAVQSGYACTNERDPALLAS